MSFQDHLSSADELVTPYEETRAGFIRLALEKNRQATPYVEEAKALKALALKAKNPIELLSIIDLRSAILTAAGVSDKAKNHLAEADQLNAMKNLIENFLEPAGKDFIDELVYRFLLTKGDALGERMRNLAGALAERKLTRTLIATLSVQGKNFTWLDTNSRKWVSGGKSYSDIELYVSGLHWKSQEQERTLLYNLTVPTVGKNIDLCLFDAPSDAVDSKKKEKSKRNQTAAYIALGELKGGIDPAGADEHWKTANSALARIRVAFAAEGHTPKTFFIGASIEKAMANEIYLQLNSGLMTNAANLTDEQQLVSICQWLINL